jgi:hypothetical protein
MTVSILSLKPAAQPAGVAGLSVRDFKPTDLQVGGCLVIGMPMKALGEIEQTFQCLSRQFQGNVCTFHDDLLVAFITSARPETVFLPNFGVMLKILSSEYHLYACGKMFRMP